MVLYAENWYDLFAYVHIPYSCDSNGSLPSGKKPSGYLIILPFWSVCVGGGGGGGGGWGGGGEEVNKINRKTMSGCINLIVLFLYSNHQYVIIMSSSSPESSMSSSDLQKSFAWKWFSKVIKLRTVLRPVYMVLGIHRDLESECDIQMSQYLHSM